MSIKTNMTLDIRLSQRLAEYYTIEGDKNTAKVYYYPQGSERKLVAHLDLVEMANLAEVLYSYLSHIKEFLKVEQLQEKIDNEE